MCTTESRPYLTCREVLDFLMAYLDGDLTPDQKREFDRHLAVCPSCVNYLDSYKRTISLGKSAFARPDAPAEPAIPEELVRAIRAARSSHP